MENPSHAAHDASTTINTYQESEGTDQENEDTDEESEGTDEESEGADQESQDSGEESEAPNYEVAYLCAGDGSDCLDLITHQADSISPFRDPSGLIGPDEDDSELSDLCDFNFALHRCNDNLRFLVQHHPLLPDSERRKATRKLHYNCVSFLGPAMIRIITYLENSMGEDEWDGWDDHCIWCEYSEFLAEVQGLIWNALIIVAGIDELIFAHTVNRAVPKFAKPSLDSAWLLRGESLSWFVAKTSQLETPYLQTSTKTMSIVEYAPPPQCGLPQARALFKLGTIPESAEKEIVSLEAIESRIAHDNPVCAICHDPVDVPHYKDGSVAPGSSMNSDCCNKPWHAQCVTLWFREAISNDCCPLCRTKWSKDSVSGALMIYFSGLREQLKEASIARELGLRQTSLRQQSILAYVNGGRKPWWPLRQASLFRYFRGNRTRILTRTTLRVLTKTHDRKQIRITQLPSVVRKTQQITSAKSRKRILTAQTANILTQTSIRKYFHGKRRALRQRLISSFLRAMGGNTQRLWDIAAKGH